MWPRPDNSAGVQERESRGSGLLRRGERSFGPITAKESCVFGVMDYDWTRTRTVLTHRITKARQPRSFSQSKLSCTLRADIKYVFDTLLGAALPHRF